MATAAAVEHGGPWPASGLEEQREAFAPRAPSNIDGGQPAHERATVHEIRNLLNGAKLHLTLLERELEEMGATAEARDSARIINRDIDRIAELVGRTGQGDRAGTRRAAISLRTLCTRAVHLIAGEAASAGVALASDIGFENAIVDVELSTMEQVLLGLLENAVDSALSGSGQVMLRARRERDVAVIEIKHDGPAWRGPAAAIGEGVLSAEGAAACGLTVAFRVVAAHGGAIEVDSESGRTAFRVRLPICGASEDRVENCTG